MHCFRNFWKKNVWFWWLFKNQSPPLVFENSLKSDLFSEISYQKIFKLTPVDLESWQEKFTYSIIIIYVLQSSVNQFNCTLTKLFISNFSFFCFNAIYRDDRLTFILFSHLSQSLWWLSISQNCFNSGNLISSIKSQVNTRKNK